jgi:hypothetical protein
MTSFRITKLMFVATMMAGCTSLSPMSTGNGGRNGTPDASGFVGADLLAGAANARLLPLRCRRLTLAVDPTGHQVA